MIVPESVLKLAQLRAEVHQQGARWQAFSFTMSAGVMRSKILFIVVWLIFGTGVSELSAATPAKINTTSLVL